MCDSTTSQILPVRENAGVWGLIMMGFWLHRFCSWAKNPPRTDPVCWMVRNLTNRKLQRSEPNVTTFIIFQRPQPRWSERCHNRVLPGWSSRHHGWGQYGSLAALPSFSEFIGYGSFASKPPEAAKLKGAVPLPGRRVSCVASFAPNLNLGTSAI